MQGAASTCCKAAVTQDMMPHVSNTCAIMQRCDARCLQRERVALQGVGTTNQPGRLAYQSE